MALQDLLDIKTKRQKIGLSEERVNAIKPEIRKFIAFWREYPDLFVDFLVRGNVVEVKEGEFHFYFYQRVFLRCVMRHQYVYAVFPRASKMAPILFFTNCGNFWTNFSNYGNSKFI